MEVQLYVYDLTHGMARSMSRPLLGIQIDAVYHTSLVFGNIEYFFGAGIQTCRPGLSHHGEPMDKIKMGVTHLPIETILEYLDSLKQIYTPESYDLFAHNCNNFTNDFGMFLVGKGIPDHITGLPRRVLDTPFGQMLKPQLDASMRAVTQAPVPEQSIPKSNGVASSQTLQSTPSSSANRNSANSVSPYGQVINVTSLSSLETHLKTASSTAATIFFTSSTCAPCKLAYPTFDILAEDHPNALFIKIDINVAHEIASRYQIRATPTFMTFCKSNKSEEWQGADPSVLKANVERLLQQTFPPHPHSLIKAPTFQVGSMKPVTFTKIPPLDKLMAKLGPAGKQPELTDLKSFIEKRASGDRMDAPLPNLHNIGQAFRTKIFTLPSEVRFAAIDLLRCGMVDSRVSGFFAAESGTSTIPLLLNQLQELQDCPHNLRLVTIHLAANIFTSPLYITELLKQGNTLAPLLVQVIASSLLDNAHPTTRVAAASLAFNLSVANYRVRREENREALSEEVQLEFAAALLETLSTEESADATKALLLAFGYLVYYSPVDGELKSLCQALDAAKTVRDSKGQAALAKEVASLCD
ncbi:Hypothetical protein R9X50_00157100 [Acrodontium crateriforme]|uniref:Thioredoxin n=1 Tax=Acrodontium crateriforme TaxID=150365 RepID=A0AAQ3R2X0_9PEZI|nr:Hypothetical protein R9X50_00157100 [Acrodontium crateriforme]